MMRKLLLAALLALPLNVPLATPAQAATCSGGANCHACKNCKYCKNCAQAGGSCSVCKRRSGNAEVAPLEGDKPDAPAQKKNTDQ